MATLTFEGTGGVIEGNLGTANVNVNLDDVLNFDGVDDKIDTNLNLNTALTTGDQTYMCWFKLDAIPPSTSNSLMSGYVGGDGGRWDWIITDGGVLRFQQHDKGDGAQYLLDKSGIVADAWFHAAVVHDTSANTTTMYLNGVQAATQASVTNDLTPNVDLAIGARIDGSLPFDGYLADVKVYDAALTVAQIQIAAAKINQDTTLIGAGTPDGWYKLTNNSTSNSGGAGGTPSVTGTTRHYDEFSVDVHDNSTTTDGTFTVTQGKVEGLALSSVDFESDQDYGKIAFASTITQSHDNMSIACWIKRENATGQDDTILGKSDLPHHHYLQIDTDGDIRYKQYPNTLDTSAVVTDTNWHHIIVTLQGDNNGAIYLDGVAQTLTTNTVTADGTFDQIGLRGDSGDGAATADEFDGKIRDVRFYDYALSAEQAASLYSRTYPQTPKHHYKLDEGSGGNGDTVADTGTATTNNGTLGPAGHAPNWSNGTLDLDFDLVIAANGTLSAPRGDLSLVRNFQNSGVYTHNNGTFSAVGGDNTFINTTGTVDPVFYNVRLYAQQLRFYQSTTIERQLQLDSSATHCYIWANKTLTMGTATNPEIGYPKLKNNLNTGDKQFWFYAGDGETATLQGVSELYPIIFTNTNGSDIEWGYHDNAAAQIKNIDFQFDITTDTSDTTDSIKLTGDCEFDAVTINAGDTLDLNGQRAEFSGNLSNQSTGSGNGIDYDGMIFFTGSGRMDSDGASTNLDKLTLVQQGTSTSDADLAGDNLIKTFFYNQPSVTQKNHRGAIQTIIGTGTSTCGSGESPDYTNLSVATGGTLDASSSTLTVAGDFTTSGGLIGKSAGEFVTDDGTTNGNYIIAGSAANSDGWTNQSVECWIKLDHLGRQGSESTFFSRGGNQLPKFGLYAGKLRVYAGSAAKAFGGTGDNGDVANQETLVTDKWYHVAMTYNNTTGAGKLYVNGKLDLEATIETGIMTSDVNASVIGAQSAGNRHMDGVMGKISIWNHELTQAEIRELMFMNGAEMQAASNFSSNKNDCKFFYEFNEGTGATIADTGPGGNNGTWAHNNGGTAAVWAAGGTYTRGTSTLVMSKSGTQTITSLSGTFFENLTVSDGSTTQLHTLGQTGGNLNIAGNFIINEKIKPHASTPNTFLGFYVGDKTITITEPTTGIAEIVKLAFNHTSGTLTLPFCYLQTLDCAGNGGTTVQSSTLRSTAELQVRNGHTYNSSAATLEFKVIDLHNGSIVDLSGSLIEQKPASSDGAIAFGSTSVITMGNKSGRGIAIIGNDTGGENTSVNMPADGDYFMFGGGQGGKNTMEKCHMASGSDVTVQGTTLGITFADSTANVHQFIQNIDTKHMLDVDPTDDDDLSLPRPTLDNSLQLTGGD